AKDLINQGKSGRLYLPNFSNANVGFAVYYNTGTGRFEVGELKTSGGYVELFGHLLNTGFGQIKVLGGYSTITANNTPKHDVVIDGRDDSERGAGKLLIYDKAKGAPDVATKDPLDPQAQAYTTLYEWNPSNVSVTTNGVTNDPNHVGTVTSTGYDSNYLPA